MEDVKMEKEKTWATRYGACGSINGERTDELWGAP